MPSRDDSSPAGHLAAAREALEKGDLTGATRSVAAALGEDPNRADALGLLEEIIAAAPDPLELLPQDDLPGPSNLKAVHAYLLADQGRIPEAVDELLETINDRPDVLYLDWVLGWMQRPEAAGKLDTDRLASFVATLLEQYAALTAPHGGGRDTLARMPLFIQLVRRTQKADSHFLTVSVALLRRLGNLDEALQLAREAYALEPGEPTAVALAYTHAARRELDQALQVYRDAISNEPADVSLHLGLADLLVNHDRLKEAEEIYAEVLEREPNQEVAQPSYYFLRLVSGGDESWRDKLLLLANEQPDNERAQRLAQQVTPYLGHLPEPLDVTATLRKPAGEHGGKKATLPYLEAPSNYLAFDWLRQLDVTVLRVQKPDPRLPRGPVAYLLWRYDENQPRAAVAPPASEVSQPIARLAAQAFHLETWCNHARRLAEEFGPDRVEDVLATMVYPPGAAHTERPAAWVYRVQVAAALVVAYLDEGWQDSVRRKALFALAYGPMDWTVDAALAALMALARQEEEIANDVVRWFRELRRGLTESGSVSYYPALLWCSLHLPNLEEEEREDLRRQLRRWLDTRKAERHYRQAQTHAEKGEFDRAIEALTETVRLDPGNADAFRERATLALRRSDAQRAAADFSDAIRLQPEMAAAHLGRGQAHLKLGRLELAIGDFSEATRLAPWDWQPWYRRGLAHSARKEHEQAIADFSEAARLAPELTEPYLQRALACTQLGRLEQAIGDYTELVRLNPPSPLAYNFRGRLYHRLGKFDAALADHLKASELDPGNANTHSQLAWIWATCPDAALRDGQRAVDSARKACELTDWKKAHCLDVLAAAHAENGRFDEALQWAQKAVELAPGPEKPAYTSRLEAFRQGQPWRDG